MEGRRVCSIAGTFIFIPIHVEVDDGNVGGRSVLVLDSEIPSLPIFSGFSTSWLTSGSGADQRLFFR